MSVVVEFPENLVFASREDPDEFEREVKIHTVARLMSSGRISAGVASKALECDRLTLFQLLAERGYAVFEFSESELEAEAKSSRDLGRRARPRTS